ncbi:MAG: iron-containing alcohol dehydrogenase [Acetobacter sp.]|nr:iron-containing alcohol dehydrogenase [Bacteroides sp.]MCM1341460.1 iron-containing alcohol dehydrogenase [Acetobacter sp.]MCM1433412.1 iron-containing alcohol dehydrogenase [Clostridiales bacterium]
MNYNNDKFLSQFTETIKKISPKKILFVCSSAYDRYGYRKALNNLNIESISFTGFEPCPEVSSVMNGIELMKKEKCDFIVAVGGGSAIDTAKGIKYYAESDIQILAVPTTAGTGAEVTRFSVLYRSSDKESVRSYDIIPEYQIFDYTTLKSLPYGQKAVTGLDAFAHAIEAYWSDDATTESREYSKEALRLFNDNFVGYMQNDENTFESMMKCSELAGRAINIAQTTACHAFSYKLHKLKGYFHGHAVAICLIYIWQYMKNNGSNELLDLIAEVEEISGYNPNSLKKLLTDLGLNITLEMTVDEFDETVNGVDVDRLKNHPMKFTKSDLISIYKSFITIK